MKKSEIIRLSKTERGQGFNPALRYTLDIKINGKDHFFDKPFNAKTGTEIMLTTMENDYPEHQIIGDCNNKAEFIDVVYKWINNILG